MTEFRHLRDDLIHQGQVVGFYDSYFEAPDGTEIRRDVVRHPGAVSVVPVQDDGTVLLVKQYRAPIDADLIEIPAGKLDIPGEDLAAAAAREMAEEVGRAGDVEPLAFLHHSPGFCDEVQTIFLGTNLVEVPSSADGVEEAHMEVLTVPLSEAVEWVMDGTITDGKSMVGLLAAARRLGI